MVRSACNGGVPYYLPHPLTDGTEGADKDARDLRDMQIQGRLRDHGEELLHSWKIGQFEKHTKVRHLLMHHAHDVDSPPPMAFGHITYCRVLAVSF